MTSRIASRMCLRRSWRYFLPPGSQSIGKILLLNLSIIALLVAHVNAAAQNFTNTQLMNAFWFTWGVTSRTDADWRALAVKIRDLSAMQNNGVPQFVKRTCHAQAGACVTSIFFIFSDGARGLLREAENAEGKTIARDMCSFNSHGDVRTCVNFDTNQMTTEMRDADGEWRDTYPRNSR